MEPACALLRVLVVCAFSAWVLSLWSGIHLWQVGIQQQIDRCGGENSFRNEVFGQSCLKWACDWGFFIAWFYGLVSIVEGRVRWNSRLFTT